MRGGPCYRDRVRRDAIRSRLVRAMVSVGAAAGLTAGLVGTWMLGQELERQVVQACQARARAVADRVLGTIGAGQSLLERLAVEVAKGPLEPGRVDPLVGSVLAWNPLFHSIYVYDPRGEVVLRRYGGGAEPEEGRSRNLSEKSDRDLREAGMASLADGQGRLLAVRRSPAGTLFLPCLAPVRSGAGVAGLLSGAISASGFGFSAMLEGQAPGRTGFVALLDRERRLLAVAGPSGLALGEPVRLALAVGESGGEIAGATGAALGGRAELPEVGLEVLVVLPRAEALAGLPRAIGVMGLATLAALALAALLGIWLGDRTAGPLEQLTRGILRVGEGAWSHRVPVEGDDEVAEAAREFNHLVDVLERMELVDRAFGAVGTEPGSGPEEGGSRGTG